MGEDDKRLDARFIDGLGLGGACMEGLGLEGDGNSERFGVLRLDEARLAVRMMSESLSCTTPLTLTVVGTGGNASRGEARLEDVDFRLGEVRRWDAPLSCSPVGPAVA